MIWIRVLNLLEIIKKQKTKNDLKKEIIPHIFNSISPIKNNIVTGIVESISSMEFETVDYKGTQISFCITIAYLDSGNQIISQIFLIYFIIIRY